MGTVNVGDTFDRYVVEAQIGRGGMATVYRVRHTQLNTSFALKVLDLRASNVHARLLQEGQVQAALRHANIVAVTDVIDVHGQPGLVMEFVQGTTLDVWQERFGGDLDVVEDVFRGIVAGVGFAHQAGLVHRDLKPGNILVVDLEEGFVPKVTDFGLVKVLVDEGGGTSMTRSGVAMGTPSYMAPEQIRDSSTVDQRADMFALGCILYELVCDRLAFSGADGYTIFNAVVEGRYVSTRELRPDLPERIHVAIAGLLDGDRNHRIGSCGELRKVLWPAMVRDSTAGMRSLGLRGASMPEAGLTAVPATQGDRSRPPAPSPVARSAAPVNGTVSLASWADSVMVDAPAAPAGSPQPGGGPSAPGLPVAVEPPSTAPVTGPPATALAPGQTRAPTDPPVRQPTLPEPEAPRRPAWVLPLAALALLGVGAGAAWMFGGSPSSPVAETGSPSPSPAGPVAASAPGPTLDAPTPAAGTTAAVPPPVAGAAPATPSPAASAPADVAAPRTASASPVIAPPVARAPSSAAASPAPAAVTPAPTPSTPAPSTPALATAVTPPAAVAGPTTAHVAVTGDAAQVSLLSAGRRFSPGDVPPGKYAVEVTFSGGSPVSSGSFSVEAGESVTLKCSAGFGVCNARKEAP